MESQPTLEPQPDAAKPTAAEVKLVFGYFGTLPGTKLEEMLDPICASSIMVRNLVRKEQTAHALELIIAVRLC